MDMIVGLFSFFLSALQNNHAHHPKDYWMKRMGGTNRSDDHSHLS